MLHNLIQKSYTGIAMRTNSDFHARAQLVGFCFLGHPIAHKPPELALFTWSSLLWPTESRSLLRPFKHKPKSKWLRFESCRRSGFLLDTNITEITIQRIQAYTLRPRLFVKSGFFFKSKLKNKLENTFQYLVML
jgi:hypothetical protein